MITHETQVGDTPVQIYRAGDEVFLDLNRELPRERPIIEMAPDHAEDLAHALLAAASDARRWEQGNR